MTIEIKERHIVRKANVKEKEMDCCGDRYESNIDYVCSCGKKLCDEHMKNHILALHMEGQRRLNLQL